MGETWVDVDPANESAVMNYFEGLQKRNAKCDADPKWKMTGTDGTVYNYLDFLGSNVLSQDIDLLRRALEVPEISLQGISYGTCVASAYSSSFKNHTKKIMLDSNCPANPEAQGFSTGAARALEQAVDKLLNMCAARRSGPYNASTCELGSNPFKTFNNLVQEFRSPGVFAPSPENPELPAVRLGLGMMLGYLSTCLNLESWATTCMGHLIALASHDTTKKQAKVAEILDAQCIIPNGSVNWGPQTISTWRVYGVCIGSSHIGMANAGGDSFLDQTGIMGVDFYGRWSLDSAMRVYKQAFARFAVPATGAFLGWFGALFDWQVVPNPIRSGSFNEHAKVLVANNLYDPGMMPT